jgi:hypothetical protein
VGIYGSQVVLISRLHPTRELSEVVQQRGQIVAAPLWSVNSTTSTSLCQGAFISAMLSDDDHVGGFTPEHPLRSRYVRWSEGDRERGVQAGMALGCRVLTADACLHEVVRRARTKARRRRWSAGDAGTVVAGEGAAGNLRAADGPGCEAWPLRLRGRVGEGWGLMKTCRVIPCSGGGGAGGLRQDPSDRFPEVIPR